MTSWRSRGSLAVAIVLALAFALVVSSTSRTPAHEFVFVSPQDLPPDVRSETDAVIAAFTAQFRSVGSRCTPTATLLLVPEVLGGDARYVESEQRIEIEIPTSPRRFRDSLVHELAHHLDATCEDAPAMRREWLVNVEDDGVTWTSGEWSERPSEQFAEAVVHIVLGERVRHGRSMPLPAFSDDLVRSWMEMEFRDETG